MTKTVDIIDTEYVGQMRTRTVSVDITNYDDDAAGDGESFSPKDAGLNRFKHVTAEVNPGGGSATTVVNCVAQYDYNNEALRLYYQSDSGGTDAAAPLVEVESNVGEGAEVRLICYGQ